MGRPIMSLWDDHPGHDYDSYLAWFGEQPCEHCYEDNDHCVCQLMDEMDQGPVWSFWSDVPIFSI